MEVLKSVSQMEEGDFILLEWSYGDKYKPVQGNIPTTSSAVGKIKMSEDKRLILMNVLYSNDSTVQVGKPIALSDNLFQITDARRMGFKFKKIAKLKESEVSIYMI